MAARPGETHPDVREARDVMAFGQEVGRVLSDGRIVGRAEPFAKVFPSSRAVKRAVGLIAWGVLEDIALDARIDDRGRLVAETHVRRIAEHLDLSKNTVHKHLARLREFGFVLHEELRQSDSGRYEVSRYVIDPTACIERFTTTPAAPDGPPASAPSRERPTPSVAVEHGVQKPPEAPAESAEQPRPKNWYTGDNPRPKKWDTEAAASQSTGHRDLGQNIQEEPDVQEQQHAARAARAMAPTARDRLIGRLTEAGVTAKVAGDLLDRHDHRQAVDALDAMSVRSPANPAGWLVRAVSEGWDVNADAREARALQARGRVVDEQWAAADRARAEGDEQRRRGDGWASAVSAALDDRQLATAVARLTRPLPGLDRRSVPAVRADLVLWACAQADRHPNQPLAATLPAALAADPTPTDVPNACGPLPPPPPAPNSRTAPDLSDRIAALLATDRERSPAHDSSLSR